MKQNNKIVLISGVSRGIGNAVALRFLKENSIVFGISRKKIIKKNLLLGYKNFFHLKGNINNVSFLFKCKNFIEKKFKKIDVIILNAAIIGEMKMIKKSNLKIWKDVVNTNLIANFYIIRIFFNLINKSKFGRIISVTTTATWKVRPLWGAYSSSKAGLEMLVKILNKENANKNLKINFVDPGRVRTNMRAVAAPKENPEQNPLPEKIVDTFVLLSSVKCKFSGRIVKAQKK